MYELGKLLCSPLLCSDTAGWSRGYSEVGGKAEALDLGRALRHFDLSTSESRRLVAGMEWHQGSERGPRNFDPHKYASRTWWAPALGPFSKGSRLVPQVVVYFSHVWLAG